MKVTALNPSVLTGQGGIGSFSLSAPNPAPGIGPTTGDMVPDDNSVSLTNPGDGSNAEASEPLPGHIAAGPAPIAAPAPSMAMPETGGAHTTTSQYSTQGPMPKG